MVNFSVERGKSYMIENKKLLYLEDRPDCRKLPPLIPITKIEIERRKKIEKK